MPIRTYDVRIKCTAPDCSAYWDLYEHHDHGTIVAEKIIGDGDDFDTIVPVIHRNTHNMQPLHGQRIVVTCPECTERHPDPPINGVRTRHRVIVRGQRPDPPPET